MASSIPGMEEVKSFNTLTVEESGSNPRISFMFKSSFVLGSISWIMIKYILLDRIDL